MSFLIDTDSKKLYVSPELMPVTNKREIEIPRHFQIEVSDMLTEYPPDIIEGVDIMRFRQVSNEKGEMWWKYLDEIRAGMNYTDIIEEIRNFQRRA